MKDVYAHNLAVAESIIGNVSEYKSLGMDTNDASRVAQIGKVAFKSALAKTEVEEIKKIVKKYAKRKEIVQAIKDNFPSNVKVF